MEYTAGQLSRSYTDMAITYICEGCGSTIYSAAEDEVPKHRMCHSCGFIETMVEDIKIRQELHVHLGNMRPLNP